MTIDRTLYALPPWADDVLAPVQALRQVGGVARYHTEPFIPPQSVAEHSWHVAMLTRALWPDESNLILAALLHDTGEVRGDLPAPSKWVSPVLKEASNIVERDARRQLGTQLSLTEEESFKLKFVDYLEACWYCSELRLAGNQFATVIFDRLAPFVEGQLMTQCPGWIPIVASGWWQALKYVHVRR
jgi:5'-deoxynucleotidase YfbR-like HD superfamily hydrolase